MSSITKEDKIKVCRCDEKTPLLWTFKFDGYEYWCPRCGYLSGMFGAGIDVPLTAELEQSKKDWQKKTKAYLSSDGGTWEYSTVKMVNMDQEVKSLTKEGFWNNLMEQYPEEMQEFCAWIDEYKKRVDWDKLFNADQRHQRASGIDVLSPKYHDLPIAMQLGIFMQYMIEQGNKYGLDYPKNFTHPVQTIEKHFSNVNRVKKQK